MLQIHFIIYFCFHYIVQPFPLVEPVFLFLLTHFKESGGAFVSDSLVSRSGQSSPFFLRRHHVTGSSQDVLSGTPHRSDGVCERVERRDKRGRTMAPYLLVAAHLKILGRRGGGGGVVVGQKKMPKCPEPL